MIFSSIQYLLFLPVVVFLYWRTKGSMRVALVVASSYFFYMSWLPVYGLLLLALSSITWLLGQGLAKAYKENQKTNAKVFLTLGLLLNLGCLCYYKYANFFILNTLQSVNWLRGLFVASQPAPWDVPILNVVLPLGISFFVFEFVHYLADIYKGNKPINSFMEFSAFASFFPSQIAGPIKRYQDFQDKLKAPETWSGPLFFEASALIVQGLFKKVAIADPIGALVFPAFSTMQTLSAADAWIASIGFVIQVYCDFSGYTDIGRGSALLLGIRLPVNFELPYLSVDLAEFWRRWHMSLSSWMRDYVYIPLGGSRGGTLLSSRNLLITMVACGFWHGASWHYLIFGGLHGIGLIGNREWKNILKRSEPLNAALDNWFGRGLGIFLTLLFITATDTVFRSPDLPHAFNMFSSLLQVNAPCTLMPAILKSGIIQFLSLYFSFWLLLEFMSRHPDKLPWLRDSYQDARLRFATPVRLASWTAALILMFAARPTEAVPFVYFQF
jgi:alginate O-acetyltransferase complex protein AlgI